MQRQATNAAAETSVPQSVTSVMQSGGGSSLAATTLKQMQSTLGADLGGVRIHTDANAARAAKDINAEAFTVGKDIYFGADRYQPDTLAGKKLLAHELTHTVQQGNASAPASSDLDISKPGDSEEVEADAMAERVVSRHAASSTAVTKQNTGTIQRYSWEELENDAASVGEAVQQAASDVGEAVVSGAEAVVEGAAAVGGAVVDAGEAAIDWLATEAGQIASQIAAQLGVQVSVTTAGLEIDVPGFCPVDALVYPIRPDPLQETFMVPVGALPIGPDVFITGQIGLAGTLESALQIQAGPICINGLHIVINPLTNSYSVSGSLSATANAALSAEVRGGVRGEVSLMAIVPIGGVPVPITAPLAALEGGLAGMMKAAGASTLTISGGLSMTGGVISLNAAAQLDLGLALDLFAGAYAEIDIRGKNVCRLYWQPYEWHGDVGISLGAGVGLTMVPGATPGVSLSFSPPSLAPLPFSQIPLAINRNGFTDDCPIKDKLCLIMRLLNLLPSQNGGSWSETGPYGPGNPVATGDPLHAYEREPARASKAKCRGACGPDCDTCKHEDVHHEPDPKTGEIWEYTKFEDCNSHTGCREHDAGFDWAADTKGETETWAIVMPGHMAANLECMCNFPGGNCIAWIAGLPPYDRTMYFAQSALKLPPGAPPGIGPGTGPGPPGGCTPGPPVPFPPGSASLNGPVAGSIPLDPCAWGLTFPEAVRVTISARCDGTNWFAVLTQLTGDFSEQVRLLPAEQEVTGPGGNTTQPNFCDQATELNALGFCPGAWYMIAAVQAHEDVHLTRFLPALVAQAPAIEITITTLSVPDAPGKTAATAATEIAALPAFPAALAQAQQTWLDEILIRVGNDHDPGGPCERAEHGVVDPMVGRICTHAKTNIWGPCPICPP